MSKILLAVFLMASFAATAADNRNFIKLEAIHNNYTNAPNDKNGINLQVGREVAQGVKLDVAQEFRSEETSGTISNRFEGGASYEQKIPYVTVGVRAAVGEKFVTGNNHAYYSVEPSVSYDLTKEAALKVSYRYRDTFDNANADRTNTYNIGAEYKVAADTLVGVVIARTTGNREYTSLQAAATYKF